MKLSKQSLPPEFKFQDTRVFKKVPASNLIYTDGLGNSGSSYLPDRLRQENRPLGYSQEDPKRSMDQGDNAVIQSIVKETGTFLPKRTARRLRGKTINLRIDNHPLDKPATPRGYNSIEEARDALRVGRKITTTTHTRTKVHEALKRNRQREVARLGAVRNASPGAGLKMSNRAMATAPPALLELAAKKQAAYEIDNFNPIDEFPKDSKSHVTYHPSELMANGRPRPDRQRIPGTNIPQGGIGTPGTPSYLVPNNSTPPNKGLINTDQIDPSNYGLDDAGESRNDSKGVNKSLMIGIGVAFLAIIGLTMTVKG